MLSRGPLDIAGMVYFAVQMPRVSRLKQGETVVAADCYLYMNCGDDRVHRTCRLHTMLCHCKEVIRQWNRLLKKVLTSVAWVEAQTVLAVRPAPVAVAAVVIR